MTSWRKSDGKRRVKLGSARKIDVENARQTVKSNVRKILVPERNAAFTSSDNKNSREGLLAREKCPCN
jgi:hypothetical protein